MPFPSRSKDQAFGHSKDKSCYKSWTGDLRNSTELVRLEILPHIFILMYSSRRDGSPFLNLLLVAPLYDNRGAVRYFIGAQIDVTGLMENGRGIESFAKVLDESRQRHKQQLKGEIERDTKSALQTLGDLGKMFSNEESAMIQSSSRPGSVRDDASVTDSVAPVVRGRRDPNIRTARRVLGNDDIEAEERAQWGLSSAGPSGRLPGVYQNVRS